MLDRRYIHLLWLPLLLYLFALFYRLAWFEQITSIANDSVNYLLMARYYSPWVPASGAIQAAWPLQDFPPLFPLLLAISGAAHSLLAAHVLVVAMGLLSLFLLYRLSLRWLHDNRLSSRGAAILVVVIFSVSPGYVLGLQGILSESLYLFLSLLFLLLCNHQRSLDKGWLAGLAFLLALLILTRTIGWALWLAVLLQAIASSVSTKKNQHSRFFMLVASLAFYLVLQWWLGPDRESHYPGVIADFISGKTGVGESGIFTVLLSQARTLLEAWHTFWTIYWIDEVSVSYIIVSTLLFFSLLELFSRLLFNKIDAYYVLIYLGILFIWPHPGQMVRLVFPVAAILVLYSVIRMMRVLNFTALKNRAWAHYGLAGLLLAVIAPSHAFIHARLSLAEKENLVPVYEMFRRPNIVDAYQDLLVQNQMLNDFSALGRQIGGRDGVLYFIPAYPAVLGGVISKKSTYPVGGENYRELAKRSKMKFILLTRLHPRKTRKGVSGFDGEESLRGQAKKIWCSYNGQTKKRVSCLYRIQDQG